MKRKLIPVMVLLIMASYGQKNDREVNQTITQKTEIMQKGEKQKIEELLNQYKRALNTSDAALAQSLYTKNGIFMPTEAPSAIGSENILKSYEFIFSQIQLNIEFYIDEIVVENDFAFAVTSSKGTTLIHATGDTIPEANRELFVFEREAGEWKIARYMFNKTAPKL
ncbi:YybH family protein [Spongiimicrobium sp. 2-473A-2-J]|uniref:YybH family protein n=1 Tax=Eudoraea algarum TaxID=3417568 RepID=UPI003D3611DF